MSPMVKTNPRQYKLKKCEHIREYHQNGTRAKTIRTIHVSVILFFFVWLRMYWNRADLPVTQHLLSMSNNKNS